MTKNQGDSLPEWVKSGRERLGWTQADLAEQLEVTTVHLSKIENGHSEVKLSTLRRMCGVFKKPFVVTHEESIDG